MTNFKLMFGLYFIKKTTKLLQANGQHVNISLIKTVAFTVLCTYLDILGGKYKELVCPEVTIHHKLFQESKMPGDR